MNRKSAHQRAKSLRARLFAEQKGMCFFCGCEMLKEWDHPRGVKTPDNLATLDHLDDRYSEDRGTYGYGTIRKVCACSKCNHDRGAARDAQMRGPILWERSGRAPQGYSN